MKAKKPLRKFWAITRGGIYLVSSERVENNCPRVEKIVNFLGKESIPVGSLLKNGHLVGVATNGIRLYCEDHPRQGRIQRMEEVNNYFWGGGTSHIIGLFLSRKKALAAGKKRKKMPQDPRWKKDTLAVLDRIGKDHRVFIPSERDLDLRNYHD